MIESFFVNPVHLWLDNQSRLLDVICDKAVNISQLHIDGLNL